MRRMAPPTPLSRPTRCCDRDRARSGRRVRRGRRRSHRRPPRRRSTRSVRRPSGRSSPTTSSNVPVGSTTRSGDRRSRPVRGGPAARRRCRPAPLRRSRWMRAESSMSSRRTVPSSRSTHSTVRVPSASFAIRPTVSPGRASPRSSSTSGRRAVVGTARRCDQRASGERCGGRSANRVGIGQRTGSRRVRPGEAGDARDETAGPGRVGTIGPMTPEDALLRVIHCLDRARASGFKTKAFVRALDVVRSTDPPSSRNARRTTRSPISTASGRRRLR